MTDYRALGASARRAVELSPSYAHLRGLAVEDVECLWLPPENPDTRVQVALPLTKHRLAFRAGWAEAEREEDGR